LVFVSLVARKLVNQRRVKITAFSGKPELVDMVLGKEP